jgi:hypothetical protein
VKISKKGIASVAVLALGVLALIADRTVFAPASSDAAPPAPSGDEAPLATAKPKTEPAAPRGKPLSEKLSDAATAQGTSGRAVVDAFHATGAWAVAKSTDSASVASSPFESEKFLASHKISSVGATKGGEWHAIIDHRPYKVGDRLDGLELIGIDRNGVEFQTSAGSLRLDLDLPKLAH